MTRLFKISRSFEVMRPPFVNKLMTRRSFAKGVFGAVWSKTFSISDDGTEGETEVSGENAVEGGGNAEDGAGENEEVEAGENEEVEAGENEEVEAGENEEVGVVGVVARPKKDVIDGAEGEGEEEEEGAIAGAEGEGREEEEGAIAGAKSRVRADVKEVVAGEISVVVVGVCQGLGETTKDVEGEGLGDLNWVVVEGRGEACDLGVVVRFTETVFVVGLSNFTLFIAFEEDSTR